MTQSELARRWGYSQQYISRLVKQGMPLTSIAAAKAWFAEHGDPRRRNYKAEDVIENSADAPRSKLSTFDVECLEQAIDHCMELLEKARTPKRLVADWISNRAKQIESVLRRLAKAHGVELFSDY